MMDREEFVDRTGKTVREGSILRYDEGSRGSQSIDIVERHNGRLSGRPLLVRYDGKWQAASPGELPIQLVYYMKSIDCSDGKLVDASVIYVDREWASDPRNGPAMWGG